MSSSDESSSSDDGSNEEAVWGWLPGRNDKSSPAWQVFQVRVRPATEERAAMLVDKELAKCSLCNARIKAGASTKAYVGTRAVVTSSLID
jgi:hypothetical protein